jgi:hypothetical protein
MQRPLVYESGHHEVREHEFIDRAISIARTGRAGYEVIIPCMHGRSAGAAVDRNNEVAGRPRPATAFARASFLAVVPLLRWVITAFVPGIRWQRASAR